MAPATKSRARRAGAREPSDPRIPQQRLPYAKEVPPARVVRARRWSSAARWVAAALVATAVVAAGAWAVVVPLLATGPRPQTTQLADCIPNHKFFEVHVGMTRRTVLSTFASAGQIREYTPRQSLEVVHRSCARTEPWTRLLWIGYVWENGEWRVAELHKGVGIVDAL